MPTFSRTSHTILLGFAALHLLFAALVPFTFFETHYALYGYYWQWSYVDHPPLIGWLQGVVQWFSGSDFAMRIAPICLTLATQYTLVAICQRLYPQSVRSSVALAWVLQLLPLTHIAFAAAPDLPLALCMALSFWFLLDIIEHDNWRGWLGLGAAFGCAALSKYTAFTLVLSLPLALWFAGRGLRWLWSLKLWAAVLVAALICSPVLWWNWQNDWLSFRFQLGYQGGSGGWSLANFSSALAVQLGSYSPLVLAVLLLWRQANRRLLLSHKLCLAWALPVLVLFLYQAGAGRTSPHWTYGAWLSLTPALAYWLQQHWQHRWVKLITLSWAGLLTLGLSASLLLATPLIPFDEFKHPMRRFVGWQQAANHAVQLRGDWQAELDREASAGPAPQIMVYNWHYAGPIAWYTRPQPVFDVRRQQSQYSYWFGTAVSGDRGILVVPEDDANAEAIFTRDIACAHIDSLPVYFHQSLAQNFHFYRCSWH